jgi:hypothetical protein
MATPMSERNIIERIEIALHHARFCDTETCPMSVDCSAFNEDREASPRECVDNLSSYITSAPDFPQENQQGSVLGKFFMFDLPTPDEFNHGLVRMAVEKKVNERCAMDNSKEREIIECGSVEELEQLVCNNERFHKIKHTESFAILVKRLKSNRDLILSMEQHGSALETERNELRAELDAMRDGQSSVVDALKAENTALKELPWQWIHDMLHTMRSSYFSPRIFDKHCQVICKVLQSAGVKIHTQPMCTRCHVRNCADQQGSEECQAKYAPDSTIEE